MNAPRTVSRRLAPVAVAALAAALLPGLVTPAAAALPTKNTTYKDSQIEGTSDGSTITIKVGSNPHKIKKLVIKAGCGDTFTRKDVTIKDNGSFSIKSGLFTNIQGKFKSKHKATGNITTEQCGFFGGEFVAKD